MSGDSEVHIDGDDLTRIYERFDPMPEGLIERTLAAARSEAELAALDWDLELLQLIERSGVPAGARGGSAAYTLRFAYEQLDLLVRVATEEFPGGRLARLDGWVVPPTPIRVRALTVDDTRDSTETETEVDSLGRFELSGIATGMIRLILFSPDQQLATPAFEI